MHLGHGSFVWSPWFVASSEESVHFLWRENVAADTIHQTHFGAEKGETGGLL